MSTFSSTAPAVASEESARPPNPCQQTMDHAWNLATQHDKPIMVDYWSPSFAPNGVRIGVREVIDEDTGKPVAERKLFKHGNGNEYTSNIEFVYKTTDAIICITMNSIYIVSKDVKVVKYK